MVWEVRRQMQWWMLPNRADFCQRMIFVTRTKVSKTVIDLMDDLKLFGDIPQSNQMSLFDFTG